MQKKMRPPDDILRMIQDGGAGAERHHSSVNISGGCGDNNRPLPLPLSSQGGLARLPTPPRTQMFSARDEDLTVVPPDSDDSVAVFNNQAKTETWETATPASLDFGQITRDHSWNNNSGGAGGTSNNESGDGSFSRFLGLFAGKQEENWWPAPPPCPTEEEILAPEKDIEEEGWFKEVLEAENKAKEADGRNSIALTPTPMNVQEELGENSGNAISPVQPLKNEEKDAGEAETKVESSTTQELSPTGTKPKKNKKGKRSRGEVVPTEEGVEGAPNDVSETKASTETRGTGGEQLLRDAKEEYGKKVEQMLCANKIHSNCTVTTFISRSPASKRTHQAGKGQEIRPTSRQHSSVHERQHCRHGDWRVFLPGAGQGVQGV